MRHALDLAGSMTTKPFWFVWNPLGRPPMHRHESAESAIAEAERLARMNPDREFIVLASVCSCMVNMMQRVNLRPDNEIPF